jgi:DNA-binding LacI/PurR family transcriptional regulator
MHLNKHQLAERLSTATKAKIDAAVKKFDYVPSYTARALSSGKTRTIGFVVADLTLPYSSLMAATLIDETSKHDVQLLISATRYSPEKEIKCLEDLRNRHADGIIYSLAMDTEVCNRLARAHYPMVRVLDRDDRFHSIENDFTDAMLKSVNYFRRSGAEEITMIAYSDVIRYDAQEMCSSFIKACKGAGCTSNIEPVNSLDAVSINSCIERISRNPPDFLIVQGPLCMTVLKQRLQRYQNKFPRVINIIDNWEPPPLRDEMLVGVIMCYPDKIVRTAVDTLLRLINKPADDSIPRLVRVPAEFLLSWTGDAREENAIDEVKRLMGYNGAHNWAQV